jgi:hypothetical protein
MHSEVLVAQRAVQYVLLATQDVWTVTVIGPTMAEIEEYPQSSSNNIIEGAMLL